MNLENIGVAFARRKDGIALGWQRQYWENTIRDKDNLNAYISSVRFNPVKKGWVSS